MTITATRDKLRLTIGDTDTNAQLFQDDELDYFLDLRADNVLLAAADACEAAAVKFARQYDFTTDGQTFSRGEQSDKFREMAKTFRARATGITTQVATRVDGYSQDIDADDVGESAQNPRRRYYGQEDRIP